MSSLADLQTEFARALRDAGAPVPAPVHRAGSMPSERRFNVYRNNMTVSLVEAMKAVFPAVHSLVGEAYFSAVARAYIDQHPPRSPVLLRYGRRFGEFLDAFPSASGVPYLGDVARLEWARINALHAPDAVPAGIEELARVPQEALGDARLTLHPSLGRVESRWPVVALWTASLEPDKAVEVDMSIPQSAAVVRPALRVGVHPLPAGGQPFLAALEQGRGLGAAAERAMATDADFDLATQLQFLFQIGAVAAVNP